MLEPAFFDTSVWLYAYSEAPDDAAKRVRARELLLSHLPVVSGQVLQEFIAAALRKKHLGISEDQIGEFLSFTADFPFEPVTRDLILEANACAAATTCRTGTAPSSPPQNRAAAATFIRMTSRTASASARLP